jgi:ureidoacrylate peracid hydrolase
MAALNTLVTIEAQPEPVAIDLARTAVVVVDMQNDFGAEGGMFHRAGIDIGPIRAVIAPTARLVAAARTGGITIVYLTMGFHPDLSDLGAVDAPNRIKHGPMHVGARMTAPDGSEGRVLIRNTWNTQVVSELAPEPGDIVISKQRYSGFYGTHLETILRNRAIQYLVFTGCTTSVCVESTMRDAMFRDFTCVLVADCTAEPIGHTLVRSNHDASLLVLQVLFGWVSTSDQVIAALESSHAGSRAVEVGHEFAYSSSDT